MENLKVSGDVPQARFGHTITLVSKTKAVLFGGATGDTGKYSITGDAYIFDCTTRKWKKLEPTGPSPTARAAHSSTSVELNQLVIYGGATGGGQLAPDDLYLLDLRAGEDHAQWIVVPVVGTTPGRRYGHTIVFSKPYLIVFGGNTGNEPVNDVWILNVEKAPLFWTKLDCDGDAPCVRVYHSAALCSTGTANGMMVVFGGRTSDQSALNDTWGLRRHRDGRWDWVKAPYKPNGENPTVRYQHSTLFMGSYMFVVGGRTNNVGETVALELYDTESSDWVKFPSVQRFRHACWLLDNTLYIHGGFEQDSPNVPTDLITKVDVSKFFQNSKLTMPKSEKDDGKSLNKQQTIKEDKNNMMIPETKENITYNNMMGGGKIKKPTTAGNMNIRISDTVVVAMVHDNDEDKERMYKKVSIDKLQEESKKIKQGTNFRDPSAYSNNHLLYYENIYNPFITNLLKPTREWTAPNDYKFPFKKEQVVKLIDETIRKIEEQPILLHMRVPAKIYGSIHGQYGDLMRLFDYWGGPTEMGDIDSFDYLFLGNYVDRGKYSLEVLCLLLALKLKYPDQFHLLRGSHEDIKINRNFGFAEECSQRLGEDINDPGSLFQRFNKLFEYLPLAAVVENKILCVHSGIGSTLRALDDIETIQRPCEIVADPIKLQHNFLLDLLWSDPEAENGMSQPRVNGIKNASKFGTDRLKSFLGENNLTMLVRSHECVTDGFEKSANGMLMTVFSATDYCGKYTNAAAVIVIRKNFELVPKVINPILPSSTSFAIEDEKSMTKNGLKGLQYMNSYSSSSTSSTWMDTEESLKKRPATPPRSNSKGNFKK